MIVRADANGNPIGGPIPVNTPDAFAQGSASIAKLDGDRFVVVWGDTKMTAEDPIPYSVRGQIFNGDGSKSGGEFQVNTTVNVPRAWQFQIRPLALAASPWPACRMAALLLCGRIPAT